MKNLISLLLVTMFVISGLTGCYDDNNEILDNTHPYNFSSYEKLDDLSNIQQVSLSKQLSKFCVTYKFTYLSDNNQVKAYVSIPINCIENSIPYKCIVYNRGGNSKIAILNDEDTAQICIATNRVVIASQYRGADGGTGIDEFGGKDVNDVIKLIDLCEKEFEFVDMTDFCIAGVSRGGMMAYITARQDKRIKGVIAISAVSDLFQSYEERDDMKTLLTNHIGGTPKDFPEEYIKRSAIFWCNELQIPVLLIHSKLDEQVSYSQSEVLYNKLKSNNLDCTLITYEDNVHGLHKEDSKEISNWLERTFKEE